MPRASRDLRRQATAVGNVNLITGFTLAYRVMDHRPQSLVQLQVSLARMQPSDTHLKNRTLFPCAFALTRRLAYSYLPLPTKGSMSMQNY